MIFSKKIAKHDKKKSVRNYNTCRNFTDLISGISIDFYITFKHNQSLKRKMDFTLNLLGQIFIQCNIFLNNLTNIFDVTILFHFVNYFRQMKYSLHVS